MTINSTRLTRRLAHRLVRTTRGSAAGRSSSTSCGRGTRTYRALFDDCSSQAPVCYSIAPSPTANTLLRIVIRPGSHRRQPAA